MNGEYDGSITIKTAIDTSGFVAGEKDLAKSAQDAADKVQNIGVTAKRSIDRQVENFTSMNEAYRQQSQYVDELRAKLEELQHTNVESDEYKSVTAQVEKLDEQLNKTVEKIDKMVALYGVQKVKGMASFQSLQYDLERTQQEYDSLIAKQKSMQESGEQYVAADTSDVEAKLAKAKERQASMLERLNSKYKDLRANISKYSENATQAHRRAGEEGEKAFERVGKKSALSLKNILMYVVGVRTIYTMFNKIKRAASEGLQIVAQYDPQFNAAMSTMKTGISQLKADIGAMLQPILQTIVPILNMVLERLHNALMKVANVVAAIMGQDYIDVVTVKAENYAGALDNVASSAKEASKALGGYDKLNVIQSESSGGGGGAGGALAGLAGVGDGTKYERLPVELSEMWQKVVDVIHEAQDVTEEYIEAYADEGIGGVALKFAENATEVVNSLLPDPSDDSFYEGSKFERGLKSTINDLRQRVRTSADNFMELILGNPTKQIERNWGADMESAAKKAMKRLGKTVPKVADIVTEPKSKAEIQSSLSKTFKTVGSALKTGAQNLGRVFTGFFNLDSDEMTDKITTATTSSVGDPRVNDAATAVGKQISASIVSAVNFTDTDTNTVTSRTKKLISGADSVKLEAKRAGESVANSLAQGIKSVTAFSEADGKSTANQIAKGMEAVSAEANRGGSALSNALNSVGKRISEGINKGVISVPVTFTGQSAPKGIGAQLNKINTTVTITLDGKVISETVFDNAEAIVKQKGSGARAGIHYVFGV